MLFVVDNMGDDIIYISETRENIESYYQLLKKNLRYMII